MLELKGNLGKLGEIRRNGRNSYMVQNRNCFDHWFVKNIKNRLFSKFCCNIPAVKVLFSSNMMNIE